MMRSDTLDHLKKCLTIIIWCKGKQLCQENVSPFNTDSPRGGKFKWDKLWAKTYDFFLPFPPFSAGLF